MHKADIDVVIKGVGMRIPEGAIKGLLTRVDIGVRHRARQRSDPAARRGLSIDFLR